MTTAKSAFVGFFIRMKRSVTPMSFSPLDGCVVKGQFGGMAMTSQMSTPSMSNPDINGSLHDPPPKPLFNSDGEPRHNESNEPATGT